MENTEFLKYFINEDLYQIDANEVVVAKDVPRSKNETEVGVEDPTEKSQISPQQEVVSEISVPETVQVVEEPLEKIEPAIISYKGGNEKGILILVEDSTDEFLNANDLAYLLKILGAVKLSLADIALVNVHRSKNYEELDYEQVLIFTSNHSFQLPNPTKYTLNQLEGIQILLADPLNQIAASVELRKALWGSLKAIYA
ncbi:MAG: hypothetical protein ACJA2S_000723 [Cyclobacteriaceae bacterium]|jgi:hypothetical protein